MTDFNPYLEHFENVVLPQMAETFVAMVILTDRIDSKLALEVGAAILLDKPILIVTRHRSLVNAQLAKVAAKIVVIPMESWKGPGARALIQAAIEEMIPR
jgi:hypothetical protein